MKKKMPSNKNKDLMMLLTTSIQFQKIVEDARKYLEIDIEKMTTNSEYQELWAKRNDDKTIEYIISEVLNNQLKKIDSDRKQGLITAEMAKEQSKILQQKQPWNYLKFVVDFTISEFKIPLHYSQVITEYILYNRISYPVHNFSIGPWEIENGENPFDPKSLKITVYTKLDKNDLKKISKMVNSVFGKNLPSYKSIPTLDTMININKAYESRERFDPAEQKKYRITAQEVAEDTINNRGSRGKVYETKRQLERLRKSRFGKD